MSTPNSIIIDGTEYLPVGNTPALVNSAGPEYAVVRTHSAGVFAGYLAKLDGKVARLVDARRLWFWSGAASLSQLAVDGVKNPSKCKFVVPVSSIILTEAIEVISASEKARKNLVEVPAWMA